MARSDESEGVDGEEAVEGMVGAQAEDDLGDVLAERSGRGLLRESGGELVREEDEFVGGDLFEERRQVGVEVVVVGMSEPEGAEAEDVVVVFLGRREGLGVVLECLSQHQVRQLLRLLDLLQIRLEVADSVRLPLLELADHRRRRVSCLELPIDLDKLGLLALAVELVPTALDVGDVCCFLVLRVGESSVGSVDLARLDGVRVSSLERLDRRLEVQLVNLARVLEARLSCPLSLASKVRQR